MEIPQFLITKVQLIMFYEFAQLEVRYPIVGVKVIIINIEYDGKK